MSTTDSRRFVIAAAPNATAWIETALRKAFGLSRTLPNRLEQLLDRLPKAR